MIYICMTDIRKFKNEELLNKALNQVSAFRKEKYDAYHNEEVKLQSIAASYIMDRVLNEYGLKEKDMSYELTKAGKPFFKNEPEIHFSISHSKNIAMVAFCDKEIGCDVQVVKNASKELYDLVLSNSEKQIIEEIKNLKERNEKFFEYWVQKEAIVKRDGTGLRDSLSDVYDDYGYLDKKVLMDDDETYLTCVNTGCEEEIVSISI